jgi:hypothetical protein
LIRDKTIPDADWGHGEVSTGAIRMRASTPLILAVFACMAALECYFSVGIVVLVALLLKSVRRPALLIGGAFLIMAAAKCAASWYLAVPVGYDVLPFNAASAARELFTVFLTFEMFALGWYVLPKRVWMQTSKLVLLFLISTNVILHIARSHQLLFATSDNTQLISLYALYIMILRARTPLQLAMPVVVGLFLAAGLSSSFTATAALMLTGIALIRVSPLRSIQVNWRLVATAAVIFFSVASLFAYAVNLRAAETGNNGFTRSILAHSAWEVTAHSFVFGTPIGRMIVPINVIDVLGWTQYLDDQSEYNLYALSFHNSFLYLLTRFGISAIAFEVFVIATLVPKRGNIADVLFMMIPLLFMSANVVVESARAGPALALVLGSLLAGAWQEQGKRALSSQGLALA